MPTTDTDTAAKSDPKNAGDKDGKIVLPQHRLDKFWKNFLTECSGKAFTVLPNHPSAEREPYQPSQEVVSSSSATTSYERAVARCKTRLEEIVQECQRLNQKYKDPEFDIETDFGQFQSNLRVEDCLVALHEEKNDRRPLSVKRIEVC